MQVDAFRRDIGTQQQADRAVPSAEVLNDLHQFTVRPATAQDRELLHAQTAILGGDALPGTQESSGSR
jgi:hypothetical protein